MTRDDWFEIRCNEVSRPTRANTVVEEGVERKKNLMEKVLSSSRLKQYVRKSGIARMRGARVTEKVCVVRYRRSIRRSCPRLRVLEFRRSARARPSALRVRPTGKGKGAVLRLKTRGRVPENWEKLVKLSMKPAQ